MFKKKSYNVKKASEKDQKKESQQPCEQSKMTLKKKAEIKSVSKQESPEYQKRSHPKTVTTKKWVENSTFKKK